MEPQTYCKACEQSFFSCSRIFQLHIKAWLETVGKEILGLKHIG